MKRKLFNAALFAAVLVAAPASTFVSCADYDSDIENLQKQNDQLTELVNQKEATIKSQIAALEAMDAQLKAADDALAKKLEECQANCAAKLAECKAQCEAARAQLQAAINDLNTALEAAKTQEANDVKKLMDADAALQAGIDAANGRLTDIEGRLQTVENTLGTKLDIADFNAFKEVVTNYVTAVYTKIDEVKKALEEADAVLQGQIDTLKKQVAENKTAIEGEIKAREKAIDELKTILETKVSKEEFNAAVDELKKKDAELASAIQKVADDLALTNEEVAALKNRVSEVEAQVSTNTKAILDLAARVTDLYQGLDNLEVALNQAVAAQALVDAAQDAAIADAVARIAANETNIASNASAIAQLRTDLTNAIAEYKRLIAENAAKIAQNTADIATNAGNIQQNKEDIAANAAAIAQLQKDLDQAKKDLNKRIDDVITAYKAADVALGQRIDQVIEDYKAADKALDEKLTAYINAECKKLQDQIDALVNRNNHDVSGFVLEPTSYYEGIQAMAGDVYKYTKWNIDANGIASHDGETGMYCPEVVANYHVNPAKAALSSNVADYTFATLNRENRADKAGVQPVIKSVNRGEEDLLVVKFALNAPENNVTPTEHQDPSQVTVAALQYTNPYVDVNDEHAVVTSDYAVIYLNPINEVSLVESADYSIDIPDGLTPGEFAKADEVNYTKTYDIHEHIAAKFGTGTADTTLPEGFTYRYTKLTKGDSQYFKIDENGVVTPVLPVDKQATVSCVGKVGYFRIDIMRGDDVVEVGYYQLTITGEAIISEAETETIDDVLPVVCEPTDLVLNNKSIALDKVWAKVAEVSGLDADAIEENYALTTTPEGVVAQFKKYEGVDGHFNYAQYAGIGEMKVNGAKVAWTITSAQYAAATEKPVLTYIRVRSKNVVSKDTYNEFYLPITWVPASEENWNDHNHVVFDAQRVKNQWQDSENHGEKEIRVYADLTDVENGGSFHYDIANTAFKNFDFTNATTDICEDCATPLKNKADFKLTNGHFAFVDDVEAARTIEGADGTVYTLVVKNEGKNLETTTGAVVARITPSGVVTLEHNAVTENILNNAATENAKAGQWAGLGHANNQTLTARVGFVIETVCSLHKDVVVENGAFDVRFIKPLTLKDTNLTLIDAANGWVYGDLRKNIQIFNGDYYFDLATYEDVFKAKVVRTAEIADWKTDYDCEDGVFENTLGSVNMTGQFSIDPTTSVIGYKNNGAVISTFHVQVPVMISYTWNSNAIAQNYTINLTIQRTQNQSNRK